LNNPRANHQETLEMEIMKELSRARDATGDIAGATWNG